MGLSFDAEGNLYAADRAKKVILKIKPTGASTVFAARCDGAPFVAPERIAAAPGGVFYVTDAGASRACRIDSQGRASVFARDLRGPTGIAAAADGRFVFVGDRARKIWKLSADGKSRAVFATLAGAGDPAGMAIDEKGNLYIARDGGGAVTVLSAEGKLLDRYATAAPRVTDVAFGGEDLQTLYASEASTGSVYRLRARHRSQRLPWEPDLALRITEPVDGAILNGRDGAESAEGLRITVRGRSRASGAVRINGVEAPVRDGSFHADLLLRETETKIRAEAAGEASHAITVFRDRGSALRYRVSTDDNILFLKDIAQRAGVYRSIFDNAYLSFWREMHRKYGAKIQFNIYYETEGFNLSQMPDVFRKEWQDNASWIHLSFHARANDPDRPYVHATADQIRRDYRLVMQEIARFAGAEVQSPVTTVHWGATTLEATRALRAEGVRGLVGYFEESGDAPLVSYYLPLAAWRYLAGRDYWKDTREDIVFLRHDCVINLFAVDEVAPHLEKVAADPHQAGIMELMIHEQYFYPDYKSYEPDYRQRVERAIEWVARRGYQPVFYEDVLGEFLQGPAVPVSR
jgi:hypothetical protein